MIAYTARGQARIQQRDISTILRTHRFMAGAALATFERQRGYEAEAALEALLKQHDVTPSPAAAFGALLRRSVGAALVGAGQRRAGVPRGGALPESAAATDPLGMGG